MKTIFFFLSVALILCQSSTQPTAALTGIDQHKPTNHIVEIKQLKFIPASLEVSKGDTITFINNDFVDHDVTEEKNKKWTSGVMKKGASWKMIAITNVDYFCSLHVIMKGQIRITKTP